jgi:nucleotide-binding universal stress UspA family protein
MILPHVEEMASRFKARIILVQVVELISWVVGPYQETNKALQQQEFEEKTKEARSYLASLRGEFCEKGIEARTRILHGPVVEAIINAAEREGADLIAIASHGRSGLSRVFYGSVAAGVLHRIDRPLLIIRS